MKIKHYKIYNNTTSLKDRRALNLISFEYDTLIDGLNKTKTHKITPVSVFTNDGKEFKYIVRSKFTNNNVSFHIYNLKDYETTINNDNYEALKDEG